MIRILSPQSATGAEHMAIDEALLDGTHSCTLRLYEWQQPCVSLGYFQKYEQVHASITSGTHCPDELEWVRRITGGGAIWHQHEVTYCLIANRGEYLPDRSDDCYRVLHQHILAAIHQRGGAGAIQAVQQGDKTFHKEVRCFASPAPQDIVSDATSERTGAGKIVGSAARTRGQRTLIHGSLKLKSNNWDLDAAHGCGLNREQAFAALESGILDAFHSTRGGTLTSSYGELSTQERERAAEIKDIRYGDHQWVHQRIGPRP